MIQIISFQEALEKTNNEIRHLLLGNGFSRALFPDKFAYESLFKQANFENTPNLRKAFEALDIVDFETVIHSLKTAAKLLPIYIEKPQSISTQIKQEIEELKKILIQVIVGNHPDNLNEIDEKHFLSCSQFLSNFLSNKGRIYTLNYDLLLYWTLMHVERLALINDGFGIPDEDKETGYLIWNAEHRHNQNIYHLHGGLHLFDDGIDLRKFCWKRSGNIPLMQQIKNALSNDWFPLFVAEGDHKEKLRKIRHTNSYLQIGLRSFARIGNNLFIYGHSFDASDDHILNIIPKGKIKRLFVSIYGDPGSIANKRIIQKAFSFKEKRTSKKNLLEVEFYNAESANIWGKNSN